MYGPHYVVAQAIAQNLHRGNSLMAEQEAAQARGWIADQLDQGRQFDMAKTKRREDGVAHAIIEPIHEEMFGGRVRSEEHTSELQSLMRISYAVFCLKKNK